MRALLCCALLASGKLALAQNPPTIALPSAKVCEVNACFKDEEAKRNYETANNCKFPSATACAGKSIDKETQCCGKNAETGTDEIQDKQITASPASFDWSSYQKQCPNRRQSEGKPDGLWSQCVTGRVQSPADHWTVVEVIKNQSNPAARAYCIDGCSTPPAAITVAYKLNIFLFRDKDNPTGHQNSSFYGACKNHDICYQTCSVDSQLTCDSALRNDSTVACNNVPANHRTTVTTLGVSYQVNTREKCISAANRMFDILSNLNLGKSAFDMRKQQYCQCC